MSCVCPPIFCATTDLLVKTTNPECHFTKNSQALDTIMRKLAGSKRGSWEVSCSVNIPFYLGQTSMKLPRSKCTLRPEGPIGRGPGADIQPRKPGLSFIFLIRCILSFPEMHSFRNRGVPTLCHRSVALVPYVYFKDPEILETCT